MLYSTGDLTRSLPEPLPRARFSTPGCSASQAGILQRTIGRGRDPAWPGIDRLALELRSRELRRVYVRELVASLRRAITSLAAARR